MVFVRYGSDIEQSCLSEEYSLHLEDVVAVMRHLIERHIERPLLEGITIDTETIVAGKSDEVGILPMNRSLFPHAWLCPASCAQVFPSVMQPSTNVR